MNTTGTVPLDWLKVDRIESTQFFAVELSDGSYLAGIISKVPDKDTINDFRVTLNGHTTEVSGTAVGKRTEPGVHPVCLVHVLASARSEQHQPERRQCPVLEGRVGELALCSYNDFIKSDEQQLDLRAAFGGFAPAGIWWARIVRF